MSTNNLSSLLRGVRAIIFDMDGVVIDSEPLHEMAQEAVFEQFDLSVPSTELITFKGRAERDVFRDVLDRYGDDRHDLDTIVNAKHAAYQRLLRNVQPVDGVLELIRTLGRRFPLALTTSAIAENQRFVFQRLDLEGVFEVVVTAADVINTKPHPEPYLITAEGLGLPPEQTLVLEDSRLGIRSARDAGCIVVGVTGTFSREDLAREAPHLIIDHFRDLETTSLCRSAE